MAAKFSRNSQLRHVISTKLTILIFWKHFRDRGRPFRRNHMLSTQTSLLVYKYQIRLPKFHKQSFMIDIDWYLFDLCCDFEIIERYRKIFLVKHLRSKRDAYHIRALKRFWKCTVTFLNSEGFFDSHVGFGCILKCCPILFSPND